MVSILRHSGGEIVQKVSNFYSGCSSDFAHLVRSGSPDGRLPIGPHYLVDALHSLQLSLIKPSPLPAQGKIYELFMGLKSPVELTPPRPGLN